MAAVLAHLEEYWMAYALLAVCLIPILYVTRRYSVPFIQYTVEIVLYIAIMHVAAWCIVAVTRWFKEQSSMKALQEDGRPVDAPEWTTPFFEFWNRELYTPPWLVWVEVVAAVLIVIAVFRFRPMRIQHKRGWSFKDKTEKKKTSLSKPPGPSYGARMSGRGGRR